MRLIYGVLDSATLPETVDEPIRSARSCRVLCPPVAKALSLVVLCNAHEVDHDVPGGGGLLEGDDDAWKRKTASLCVPGRFVRLIRRPQVFEPY